MSETQLPVPYDIRPQRKTIDGKFVETGIIQPNRARPQSEKFPHSAPSRLAGSGMGLNDKIARIRAGFGRLDETDFPAQSGSDFPGEGGFSAPSTPYQGGGGYDGTRDQPRVAPNGWEADLPSLKWIITQDIEGFVVIGIRVKPEMLRRLALYMALVLLLIAIGIYNLPEIGIGNILDLVFAFR